MSKILYAIKTTEKYSERIKSLFDTWMNGIDDYIIYSDHEDVSKNIIKVCEDSSYGGLEDKGINFFNLVKDIDTEDNIPMLEYYDWLFLVDDDTFVNVKKLEEFVSENKKEAAYGYVFSYQTHSDNPMFASPSFSKNTKWYSGGAGLLIHTNAFKKVDSFVKYNTRHDDVTIGLNFERCGVELIHDDGFHSEAPEFYGHDYSSVHENITYHHIDVDKMKKLYEELK